MIAAAVSIAVSVAAAQEKKIQKKDLPPAVEKAVDAETKGAEVKGFAKETEKGKTFYEAETMVNGHTRDLLFDAAGTLVEVEEATTLDAVPAPARAAFEKAGHVAKKEVAVDANGKAVTK